MEDQQQQLQSCAEQVRLLQVQAREHRMEAPRNTLPPSPWERQHRSYIASCDKRLSELGHDEQVLKCAKKRRQEELTRGSISPSSNTAEAAKAVDDCSPSSNTAEAAKADLIYESTKLCLMNVIEPCMESDFAQP